MIKRLLCCFILTLFISSHVSAAQNYSYTMINDESYNASSPIGYTVSYPQGSAFI